ncbi:MAG: LLM class flavin-dependent oxidoreductase [Microbacterium ginsengisoli]|uniref:LLM class flavin-dependent oxidoreductase n=1 Tax=Microbacterium TaxID=33882 RepID=UPI0006FD4CA3|nr:MULTISPECIES: LLM class flavin-dependent oxidoreductase [unclassified Microbacterium]KQR91264.1 5,10-methylene tetrahydromethanopterin reductase [Microbacterium sp. Leaf347]KQS01256.1 5,10-methylene tetrahydromethanopterin reductase [Microbacterium sp. Leaf351]MBN9197064.1 LLM class flavin-dependent oxidoreductase [Microbacterium ginsengisoli]OJU77021.1 MAG: 5,10-methylene tetrahydromethanopterin reductase [Microbacterium sp. 71-23]
MPRRLHLNAFENFSPGNIASGLWQHPQDDSRAYRSLTYWTRLARDLEAAGFDAIFLADVLGVLDVYKGGPDEALRTASQVPIGDPLTLVSAMAAVTERLGFAVTSSVSYTHPYTFARSLASLDHLSGGRVGWNIVTSYLDSAARNLGRGEQLAHDERYDLGDEFLEVTHKLWELSWDADAAVVDKERGVYVDPELVRPIGHEGRYFSVPDEFLAEPSPQRTPVLFQAGSSSRGQRFAAEHAEGVFVHGTRPEVLAPIVANVRAAAEAAGRARESVRVLAVATIVTGETDEIARAKFADLQRYADYGGAMVQFAGPVGVDVADLDPDIPLTDIASNGAQFSAKFFASADPDRTWTLREVAEYMAVGGMGPTIVGSGATVADELERWAEVADLDGFNLAYAVRPGTFDDIIRYVVPELRRRGVLPEREHGARTLREALFGDGEPALKADHPHWRIAL